MTHGGGEHFHKMSAPYLLQFAQYTISLEGPSSNLKRKKPGGVFWVKKD